MFVRTSWRARMRARALLTVLAAAAVAASLAPTSAVADTRRDDLDQTQSQLKDIEAVLRDARADASVVAAAAASADEAVAAAKSRLDAARAREAMARADRIQAERSLAATGADLKRDQDALSEQARNAYMTGGMSDLAALVDAEDLSVLADRAITLNYVAAEGSDTISQLELARRRDEMMRARMVTIERERADATAAVTTEVSDLRRVQAVRQRAKVALDAKIARLANQAAGLRAHSAELRKLIQQEQAAQARAAAATPPSQVQPSPPAPSPSPPVSPGPISLHNGVCDLSSTSPPERWIIMHESSGRPTAQNPNSTAFGLGQLLLGNRILYLGSNYATTDCALQLSAFRSYVRDRYGTAAAAQAFWQAHGWY
jgi:peptidoglycan hydrolase CwlO-like protein